MRRYTYFEFRLSRTGNLAKETVDFRQIRIVNKPMCIFYQQIA